MPGLGAEVNIGQRPGTNKTTCLVCFFQCKNMNKYYTAIAFFPAQTKNFIKYRNVKNVNGLVNYLQRKGAKHVNIYDGKTKEFIKQISIN